MTIDMDPGNEKLVLFQDDCRRQSWIFIMICLIHFSFEVLINIIHERLETKFLKRTIKKNTPHFYENSKWRSAAILNLISKVKFDSRNEIRRSKNIENHVLHYFVRWKMADFDVSWVFQDGRRRPSWIFKFSYIFSLGSAVYLVKQFYAIKY